MTSLQPDTNQFMHKTSLLETLHYLGIGLLVCTCGYLAYQTSHMLSLFDAGQLPQFNANDISTQAEHHFRRISKINFVGFLVLCFSAATLYIKNHAITPFFANLIGYFIVLCMTYFWVDDLLFVFQKRHELWQGEFSASLMIVPIKLAMAGFMGYVSYLLAKHIKSQ